MTAYDENILLSGADDITLMLLRNKIYEPDVVVEDLLEGDVEAILIFLRNSSFGPEMVLNLVDSNKKPFQTTVMLDKLKIIDGKKPNDDGTFTTTLKQSNAVVKLRPLSYGETMELNKLSDLYPQNMVAPKVTERLSRYIVELNGDTNREVINKFVNQMPVADSKEIKRFMDENVPRLDMRQTVITPSGEKLTVNVGFGVEFFRPFF